MNLYLISQSFNDEYDTYDAAVVAALSEDDARTIVPNDKDQYDDVYSWAPPEYITVKLLCENYEGNRGVILASFNAG